MGFADNFIAGYQKGQTVRRNKRLEEEAEEDRGIEKELLAHRLKELKIADKVRARTASRENYEMLEGRPENDFRQATDADMAAPTVRGGIPGQVPQSGMVPVRPPTINIPGIEELGVGGVSARPQTMEELLAQANYATRQKALNTPQSASRGERIVLPGANGEAPQTLAEGGEFREPRHRVVERDAEGKETERWLTDEEVDSKTFDRSPRPASNGGRLDDDEMKIAVAGFADGSLPLDLIPKSADGIRLLGGLKKAGVNVTKGLADIKAFRSFMTNLQGGEKQKILMSADAAELALDEFEKAIGDDGMIVPGTKRYADITTAAGPLGQAIAVLKAGGAGATNKALEDAEKMLAVGFRGMGGGTMKPRIARLREELKVRIASVKGSFVSTSDIPGAPAAAVGGATPVAAPAAPAAAPAAPAAVAGPTVQSVAAALKAMGRASDEATAKAVMANPEAMAMLFPKQ